MQIPVAEVLPECRQPGIWSAELERFLSCFDINTPKRVAAFLAQCGHESAGFNVLEENLNYSAQALLRVFPKYFKSEGMAADYSRKPAKIGNLVYGNRMGNGPPESGDGYRYRGRGILQVTGKNNYGRCSTYLFSDDRLVLDPDLLLIPENAILSAGWFWEVNNLNPLCDSGNFVLLTKRINGGTNGLPHRQQIYEKALRILNV
jgi:putative chitinase